MCRRASSLLKLVSFSVELKFIGHLSFGVTPNSFTKRTSGKKFTGKVVLPKREFSAIRENQVKVGISRQKPKLPRAAGELSEFHLTLLNADIPSIRKFIVHSLSKTCRGLNGIFAVHDHS